MFWTSCFVEWKKFSFFIIVYKLKRKSIRDISLAVNDVGRQKDSVLYIFLDYFSPKSI